MNLSEIQEIVSKIKFGKWVFHVKVGHGGMHLQAEFAARDACFTDRSAIYLQTTRKWLISPYMTKSEVVQTAFKCVLTAVEHETREFFLYRNKAIFGPHFDVDALWYASDVKDERKPA
jgi:hypothetical protein